jgi:hypothetical protein
VTAAVTYSKANGAGRTGKVSNCEGGTTARYKLPLSANVGDKWAHAIKGHWELPENTALNVSCSVASTVEVNVETETVAL